MKWKILQLWDLLISQNALLHTVLKTNKSKTRLGNLFWVKKGRKNDLFISALEVSELDFFKALSLLKVRPTSYLSLHANTG